MSTSLRKAAQALLDAWEKNEIEPHYAADVTAVGELLDRLRLEIAHEEGSPGPVTAQMVLTAWSWSDSAEYRGYAATYAERLNRLIEGNCGA